MLNVVVLDTLHEDKVSVSGILKDAVARRELPIKRLFVYRRMPALLERSDEAREAGCDVFIAAFSKFRDEYVMFAQALRRQSESVFIVFVVTRDVDITSCARPSVSPSGILFIPPDRARLYQTVEEIYLEYLRAAKRDDAPPFVVKTGSEYFMVNTGDISFFEARGKKIAMKTRGQVIAFYSNFESVLEQLPAWFVRCHKGFVVNTKQIAQVNFADMSLALMDRSTIPISRMYRHEIRRIVENGYRGAKEEPRDGGLQSRVHSDRRGAELLDERK